MATSLGEKRLTAVWAVFNCVVRNGAAFVTPTPGGELPKQLLLTASDVFMYTNIWKTYFEEELTSKQITEVLAELGLVTIAAGGTAYIASKATTALLKEITNWTGPLGWGVTATIAGSFTGLFGVAWALYCDNLYQQKHLEVQS